MVESEEELKSLLMKVKEKSEKAGLKLSIQKTKTSASGPYIYSCGQESFRRNGVALIINKRVQNTVHGCNLNNDRIISVHFHGKPLNITEIQVHAPTTNVEEAEVEQFYENLEDLLELTHKKRCPFHHRGLKCKSRKSRDTCSNR